ncbi:MAG: hypothetical protein V1725_05880 [archaeon]
MRKLLFFILALVVLVSVQAREFDVQYSPIKNDIYGNETALFNITLSNELGVQDRYAIYSTDVYWIIEPSAVSVAGGEQASFILHINPISNTPDQIYLVPVTFRSSLAENKFLTADLTIALRDENELPLNYVINVGMKVTPQADVDPRDELPIEITLNNRNGKTYDKIIVDVSSTLFSKQYLVQLGPWEERSNTLKVKLDALQDPGTYPLDVRAVIGNDTIASASSSFVVIGYSTIPQDQDVTKGFFSTKTTTTLKNVGNYKKSELVKVPSTWFSRMFTSATPAYMLLKEKGRTYLSWDIVLNPDESYQLMYETNYQSLFWICVLLVLIILGYFIFRNPLIVEKKARVVGSAFEGISTIKLKVYLRNRTGKTLQNIKVIDLIPSIAELVDESLLGTLKPTKIFKHERSGMIARWDLEKIDPFEERIISYKLKSKLKIVGDMTLPAVKVKFEVKGKQRTAFSEPALLIHPLNEHKHHET